MMVECLVKFEQNRKLKRVFAIFQFSMAVNMFSMAISCLYCDAGVIPPLDNYYRTFILRSGVPPLQLFPNAYSLLAALRRLFDAIFGRGPIVDEILYFYK